MACSTGFRVRSRSLHGFSGCSDLRCNTGKIWAPPDPPAVNRILAMVTSTSLIQLLTHEIQAGIRRATEAGQLGALTVDQLDQLQIVVEIPNDLTYGDYACPSALAMARLCRQSPAQIAQTIADAFALPDVEVSVAGKGFINFRLGPTFIDQRLQELLDLGKDYGKTRTDKPERILLEFVSANPTGFLHVGHGRWAAVGSTLAHLLTWTGHHVDTEFYINDAGNQMQLLGQSLQARVKQVQGEKADLPAGGYEGTVMIDMAHQLLQEVEQGSLSMPTTPQEFTDYAYHGFLKIHRDTLHQFQTDFDQWFSERRLHAPDPQTQQSAIDQTLRDLEDREFLYRAKAPRQDEPKPESEEAVYFKTADFGDDKDRVVIKGDGSRTYLAADIAYHRDKVSRGYERLINILGSDHHGYVSRLQAAVGAFTNEVTLEAIIGQFVKLLRTDPETGEKVEVKMSKRKGEGVTVNDLIEDEEIGVGVDAARWFLLTNSMDSIINFDLDLARNRQTLDNPVVYAHYSHARCCTLLRRVAAEKGTDVQARVSLLNPEGDLIFEKPEERILVMQLIAWPDEIKQAAEERAPHKIIRYIQGLASSFNKFYDECRIFPIVDSDPPLAMARLQLVKATRQVLYNALTGILGISAPESM